MGTELLRIQFPDLQPSLLQLKERIWKISSAERVGGWSSGQGRTDKLHLETVFFSIALRNKPSSPRYTQAAVSFVSSPIL